MSHPWPNAAPDSVTRALARPSVPGREHCLPAVANITAEIRKPAREPS